MENLFLRDSKFSRLGFEPSLELNENIREIPNILVVGAGGLGCEILKNLALIGFKNITIIDLDTIELSNLNRQFLFREKDIKRYKAEVATEFIKKKYPELNVEWLKDPVQSFSFNWFKQFHVIIGGLDNLEARRWLNELVHNLVLFDENGEVLKDTVIPYIDGGTEGFRGQSRVIIPYETSCFECTMNLHTDRNVYALCTLAETPRLPEHCIEYIYLIKWRENFDRPIDKDSYDDINWVCEQAKKRAFSYGIEGVNYSLTLGVIKNVIPAIASTNAIIAASTVLETVKYLSGCSKLMDNYWMYMGHEGLYSSTDKYDKNEKCNICSKKIIYKKYSRSKKLIEFIEDLKIEFCLVNPSLFYGTTIVYVSKGEINNNHICRLNESLYNLYENKIIGINSYLNIVDEKDNLKIWIEFI